MPKMHAAISNVAEHGHLESSIGLAKELLQRGHKVTFVVTDECIRRKAASGPETGCAQTATQFFNQRVPSASLLLLPSSKVTPEDIEKFMQEANLAALFELFHSGAPLRVRTMQERHATEPFDLIISDVVSSGGILAAEMLGVPLIVSSPLPLYQVAREALSLRVPSLLIGRGRSVESPLTLRGRLGNLLEHAVDVLVLNVADWRCLNAVRAELGMSRIGLLEKIKMEYSPTVRDAWYLQNSFWGLETSRLLSPRVFLIGTGFDVEATLEAANARDSTAGDISGGGGGSDGASRSGGQWLGFGGGGGKGGGGRGGAKNAADMSGSGNAPRHPVMLWLEEPDRRPVVYFSLGTLTRPQSEQYAALLKALAPLPVDLILSVREDMQPRLPQNATADESPLAAGTAVLFSTVPQVAVLAHPRTKAFISHCGANSIIESLALGKPVIGMPIAWDQLGLCDQARIAGAALCVPLKTFFEEALQAAVMRVVFEENEAFTAAAVRQGKLLRFAGGPRKAADVAELRVAVGPQALSDPLAQRPLLVEYNLDMAMIALFALTAVLALVALLLWELWKAVAAAASKISRVKAGPGGTASGPAGQQEAAPAGTNGAAVSRATARNSTGNVLSRTKED